MVQLSKKHVERMKKLLKERSGKEVTYQEAEEASNRLANLAELAFDSYKEDQRRLKRLESEPQGYTLEGRGYTCAICHNGTPEGENWYDKLGIKCRICQDAINKKKIPAFAVKDRDSWYSAYDLESRFNLKTKVRNKWIKEGLLKARTIPGPSGRAHFQLFLIKDNMDFLPPRHLTESKGVTEEKDGKTWFRSEPWYKFCDPFETLKDYQIMDHMKYTQP